MVWLVLPMLESIQSFWPTDGVRNLCGIFFLRNSHCDNTFLYFVESYRHVEDPRKDRSLLQRRQFVCLTVSLVRIVPGYFDRHYSIRDSSRDLGRLLPASARIATFKAETLFNNNNLRYSSSL